MTFWVRTVRDSLDWTVGFHAIARFFPGDTLLRVHFGWGFNGVTPLTGNMLGVMQNVQVWGMCTTVGDGGGPPPNARTDAEDVLPPSQRWIFWEARAPIPTTVDAAAELVTWRDSGPQQPMDSKAMVSASSVPEGEELTLWASWAAAYDWPIDGQVHMWYWASILGQGP